MPTLVSRFQRSLMGLNRLLGAEIVERTDAQITGTQMFMLHYINQSKKCRLTELADKLEVKPSAVTVMIDRLEKSELVLRTHDADDRRAILVMLTPKGEEVLEKAQRIREEIVGAYMAKLNPEEVETATRVLEQMFSFAQQHAKCSKS